MVSAMHHIKAAGKTTLSDRGRLAAFLLLTPLIASLLFLIPVKVIPGNDILFQASQFQMLDYLLLLLVATLQSLLLVMSFSLFRRNRHHNASRAWSYQSLGIMSGVPAFLFGSKLCPVCLGGILGFLGPGALFFVIEYRAWFFAASAALLLLSLYAVARKVNGVCELCVAQPA